MILPSKSELQAELEFLRQRVDTSSSSHHALALPSNIANNSTQPQNSATPQSQISSLTASASASEGASQTFLGVALSSPMSHTPAPPLPRVDLFSSGAVAHHPSSTKGQSLQDLNVDPQDIDECFSL